MLNDIRTLKRIKEGDIKAFEKLFKQYYSPLCIYAASFTGRMEIAEEIIQDLFYYLWKERESIHILHSLKSYLYKSVRNRSLQHIEHLEVRGRYQEALRAEENNYPNTPLQEIEYKELQKIIDQALLRLPERRQKIFRMHRIEGLKYSDIAIELGISVKTVEAEISKTLQTLKKEIENYTRIA